MDEYLVPGKNYMAIKPDAFDIKQKLEIVLQTPGKYLGRERTIQESVKHWTWERCVNEHLKVYHQVMTGRAPLLKWAHGKMAQDAARWWVESGDKRKAKLDAVYKIVSDWLEPGKTLVIGATEAAGLFQGSRYVIDGF